MISLPTKTKDLSDGFYLYTSELERGWRNSLPNPNEDKLISIFGGSDLRGYIARKVLGLSQKRAHFLDGRKRFIRKLRSVFLPHTFGYKFWLAVWQIKFGEEYVLTEQQLLFNSRILLKMKNQYSRVRSGRLTEEELGKAKNVPIETLFEGKAQKVGKTFRALCPFHEDSKPSFVIYPETNHFHCFGCGEHGDSIAFVMKSRGYDFREAVKFFL